MPRPENDGHVLLVHPPGECPNHNDPEYYRACQFCDGGLQACTICYAFEGAWPDECPGELMTYEQSNEVYAGTLNFRDGQWRAGECCRVRRPAEELLIEEGYVRGEDGRWISPEKAEKQ